MAVYIDPPLWPAHGTLWSHLVSDSSYAELHEFAAQLGFPRRSFDLDHYDVPQSQYERAVTHGALAVGTREVVARLGNSGLRVKHAHRQTERPIRRQQYLRDEWSQLFHTLGDRRGLGTLENWQALGTQVLACWNEPHRAYHNSRHLEDVLLSLNHLGVNGEFIAPQTLLAAWFHDAVYTGMGGLDEVNSGQFAVQGLREYGVAEPVIEEVYEFIVATTPGAPMGVTPLPLAHLLDSDLAIFGASTQRYLQYTQAVRREYKHVPELDFNRGRSEILRAYLNKHTIFHTPPAQQLWEQRARANLTAEITAFESKVADQRAPQAG